MPRNRLTKNPCGPHTKPPITVIIFSKDRPCQLDALLRSMDRFFAYPHCVTVLYTASSQEYERGYELLSGWCDSVSWCREADFKADLLELVGVARGTAAQLIMFLVDDIVFIRPFVGSQIEALVQDEDVVALSLRLGDNIRYCYSLRAETSPPDFTEGRRWAWRDAARGDWDYPMSLDGHVYRLSDIASTLSKIEFRNPNSLEAALARCPIERPYLICSHRPYLVNMALNMVQDVFDNRHGSVTAASLNCRFLDRLEIDIEPFFEREFPSCHIEPEISFIDQSEQKRIKSKWRQSAIASSTRVPD